ncbi:hypothetical protein EV361DRAFT_891875 [Lentinula raphanica]|nr:hypothetical protein EV361DRAFT_891875 [Lentinula raphanica]
MRPIATHFLFTITTLKLVASMESNPGGCASSQEVSSSGGESRPLSNDEKLTLQEFPLSKYCKPSENWPGKTPEDPSKRPKKIPALRLPASQVQEKRGYYEPVGTDYASNTAPDAAAAIDEDPSDTDSAIVQSTEGRSPTGKEIRLTRAFNRRRILDWDLD